MEDERNKILEIILNEYNNDEQLNGLHFDFTESGEDYVTIEFNY